MVHEARNHRQTQAGGQMEAGGVAGHQGQELGDYNRHLRGMYQGQVSEEDPRGAEVGRRAVGQHEGHPMEPDPGQAGIIDQEQGGHALHGQG